MLAVLDNGSIDDGMLSVFGVGRVRSQALMRGRVLMTLILTFLRGIAPTKPQLAAVVFASKGRRRPAKFGRAALPREDLTWLHGRDRHWDFRQAFPHVLSMSLAVHPA